MVWTSWSRRVKVLELLDKLTKRNFGLADTRASLGYQTNLHHSTRMYTLLYHRITNQRDAGYATRLHLYHFFPSQWCPDPLTQPYILIRSPIKTETK